MNDNLTARLRTQRSFRQTACRLLCSLVSLALVLFAAASSSTAQQPSVSKAGTDAARTGSITGRVLADDGRPMPNAAIFTYGIGVPSSPAGGTTDADGNFQVQDLRPGVYGVQASAPGYVVVPDAGAEAGSPHYYRIGESVNLTMIKGGVITGTVTDANGEPVIAAGVRALRVTKPSERQTGVNRYAAPRATDDRGVYRLYGLEPGVYVIVVGGSGQYTSNFNAYDGDMPTYYPSGTRDTAAELTVHAGEELTGIDVRYRGERGHIVSGLLVDSLNEASPRAIGVPISLLQAGSGSTEASTFIIANESKHSFALNGVADGEYTLMAVRGVAGTGEAVLAMRKISVHGADVTGVELKLEPLGALSGTVLLEPPPKAECKDRHSSTLEEIIITARPDEKEKPEENTLPMLFRRSVGVPNNKGEFKLSSLRSGSYRLNVQLPGDDWYVRSLVLPGSAPAPTRAKPAPQSKATPPGSFTLKSGERITGLAVTVGQGAAGLRGRVAPATEGASLPARLRVYLVPAETESAAELLRYMEAEVERDGVFTLSRIAPGHYWMLARAVAANENEGAERRPLALEASERDKLRREAESAGSKIDLQPCQRLADYVLNYGKR